MLVQAQIRDELLQFAVLVLELLDPPQLADAQPAIHLLPAVERLLRSPQKTDDLGHRRAPFCPLQRKRNLLSRDLDLFKSQLPCPPASKRQKTLAELWRKNQGERQVQFTAIDNEWQYAKFVKSEGGRYVHSCAFCRSIDAGAITVSRFGRMG